MRATGQPVKSFKQCLVLHQPDRLKCSPAIRGHNGDGARTGNVRVARNIEQDAVAAVPRYPRSDCLEQEIASLMSVAASLAATRPGNIIGVRWQFRIEFPFHQRAQRLQMLLGKQGIDQLVAGTPPLRDQSQCAGMARKQIQLAPLRRRELRRRCSAGRKQFLQRISEGPAHVVGPSGSSSSLSSSNICQCCPLMWLKPP